MLLESNIIDSFKNERALKLKVKEISQDLKDDKYEISAFVESLAFALTSTVIDMRVNGTHLLSCVLENLSIDFLSETQIKFITNFYCDRLKDHHNVYPFIIKGLLAIVQMENVPEGCVTQVFIALFENLSCQSQVRTDREKIFQIFKTASEQKTKELIKMGGDFIFGLINAIDGERDPKNLDLIFNFMPELIKNFPLLHLAEEMFEIFACYFPIDFNSSKTDPASLTRDNLANSLCNCLVASPEFAEWAVTLALEKLESDLKIAKLDSMELLMRCSNKFPLKDIELNFELIWNGLKADIFPGNDSQEIISKGLQTLKTILETALADPDISKNLQTIVLGSILCHLNDTNHRMFAPSKAIALVCVTVDPGFAADKVLNCLILQLRSPACNFDQKCKVLITISEIMTICTSQQCLSSIGPDVSLCLETELMTFVLSRAYNNEVIEILVNCLGTTFKIFNMENRKLIYKFLCNILIIPKLNLEANLKRIAKIYPVEVKEMLVEPLVQNFDTLPLETKKHLYWGLKSFVEFNGIKSIILNLILNNILNSNDIKQNQLALHALKIVLEDQTSANSLIEELLYDYEILDILCDFTKKHENLPVEILQQLSVSLNIFVTKLSFNDQKIVLDKYLPKMKLNLITDLFLTKGILGFMHETIIIDVYFDNLLEDLVTLSLENYEIIICEACHHLICTLLNKANENEANNYILKKIVLKLKEEIRKENKKAVKVLSWIAKGLTVKGHSDAEEIIIFLVELLNLQTLSESACLAFEIISMEYPELHLPMIKYLYKQKLFHTVLNKLDKYIIDYSENHVNAFAFILKMTPHTVLKINIDKVGPITLKCLEMHKISTILIALEISIKFLGEKEGYFQNHLNYLIPQYLQLANFKKSMQVRISALKCVESIGKYPTYILLHYKMDVIYQLAPILNDPKRLVRNTAVKARNLWFLIGTTSE